MVIVPYGKGDPKAMATIQKTLTYEEWLTLPEVEGVEEVVNGEIRKMPPNKLPQAYTVENLADLLKETVDRRTVRVLVTTFGLVIRREPLTTRVPDIAVFIRSNVVELAIFTPRRNLWSKCFPLVTLGPSARKNCKITQALASPKFGWCLLKRRRLRYCSFTMDAWPLRRCCGKAN